jgi:parvulin-like peptidyl-prolyl isomerase
MKAIYRCFQVTALLAALVCSCSAGKKDAPVASIDGEEIPISIVTNFFEINGATFPDADVELKAKRDALDSLIDYKLFVKGAYQAGLDKDPEVEKLVTADKTNFMFDELYRQEILPKTMVTDQEVEEFYQKLKTELHLAHIMVDSKATADSVARELKAGADFATIARAISTDQSSAVRGGDLGFISWGAQVAPEFRDAAYSMKTGETSDPVMSPYGWHIIRNLESREGKVGDKAQMFPAIKELLRSRKSSLVEVGFVKDMQERAKVEVNLDATQLLLERLKQYPDTINGAPRPDNFFPNMELLKPFERQMVLASYQGGEVSVEDYLKKIAEVPEAYRPRFDDPDSLKKVIFQIEIKNIMEYEAAQRNVEKEPEYQKRLTDFKEGIMADKFQRSVLGQQINVDEDEIQQYYNSHLEEFETPRQFHLLEIEQDSSSQISSLIRQLNQGADFGALAAQYTIRPGYQVKKGDLGFVQSTYFPKLYEAATMLEPGQISGIVQNDQGRYSVLKLVETKAAVIRPVEECSAQIRQKVLTLKRTSAAGDWVKQERSKRDIKVFPDVLEKSIDKTKYERKG